MKKILVFSAALSLALVYLPAEDLKSDAKPAAKAAKSDKELFPDKVIAKGTGFEIKSSELDDSFVAYKASLAARGQVLPEDKRDAIEVQLLDRMILTKILLSKSNDADKTKAKETTEKFVANTKKQFPSEERFNQELKASGITMEDFRKRLLDQATCEEVIDREVKAKIKISDDQVKKFYDEHPERFEQPEKVRASHILLSTLDKDTQQPIPADKKKAKEDEIKKLKFRAEHGENFADLAKKFSDDPGSRDTGGEYTFGRGEMVKPFEAAAFSLKTNQISDVVETQYGYHIIKLSEKIPAKKIALSEVSAELKNALLDEQLRKQMPTYFEDLKKANKVEILDPKKKAAEKELSEAIAKESAASAAAVK